MKNIFIIFSLLIATPVFAQAPQGISDKDIQKVMQEIEKMKACMQNIDQAEIDAFTQRSTQLQTELKSLCAGGKRDAAQNKAVDFGKEVSQTKSMKTLLECSDITKGLLNKIPMLDAIRNNSLIHICDSGL